MSIPQMFDAIALRYDRINRLLSLGLDHYWRRGVCRFLPPKNNIKLLDVATGTGEQLLYLLRHAPSIHDAVGCDPAREMLALADTKLRLHSPLYKLIQASAEEIPFPDEMFDVITIAFGVRNVVDLKKSLHEMHRVLAPHGRLIILEFSHPQNKMIRKWHRFYLHHVVPFIGKKLSHHPDAYSYLARTIETFPQGKALGHLLQEAGFAKVSIHPLTLGVVSIYVGEKA